jgi:hypothetical protein
MAVASDIEYHVIRFYGHYSEVQLEGFALYCALRSYLGLPKQRTRAAANLAGHSPNSRLRAHGCEQQCKCIVNFRQEGW